MIRSTTATVAAVALAWMCWSPLAHAQTAPPPRLAEQGAGAERLARCSALHQQTAELQDQLEREYDPLERARTEGLLRGLHEEDERCR